MMAVQGIIVYYRRTERKEVVLPTNCFKLTRKRMQDANRPAVNGYRAAY